MRRREFIWALGGGLAATAPIGLRAQREKPTVGIVAPSSPLTSRFPESFLPRMKELGWEDGRNCRVIIRWAEGHLDRFPSLVDELVAQQVNVLVVFSELGIQAAQRATTTIAIVAIGSDLIRHGLAASMARPGSNLTGINVLAEELNAKRLEILHEAVAGARRIGALGDPRFPEMPELYTAARQLDLDLVTVTAASLEEVNHELEVLESAHVDAVNVLDGPLNYAARASIIERLNRAHLPAIYAWPEIVQEGGLLGYGAGLKLQARFLAHVVSKILGGARPQDLPIEQPDRYDLAVNLKTAKLLGLTMPPSLLVRVEEVIE